MTKSWSHPSVIGYEIKVSRQDFLHDTKWHNYLPFCNEFYFVCPPDVIAPNEVSDEVGLYWTRGSGAKVYLKKKAKYRSVEIPDSLWRYILMWRAKIGDEIDPNVRTDRERWEEWLEDRRIDHNFGYMVGRAIRGEITKKITKVTDENENLKRLIAKYEDIRQLLVKLGFNPESFNEYDATRRISTGPQDLGKILQTIDTLMKQLDDLKSKMANLQNHQ